MTYMGYQKKQYNKHGRAIAFIHVPTKHDQDLWKAKHTIIKESQELHKELEEVKKLKQDLKDQLNNIH